MLHKHQGKRGTSSHKNTGVADYFAVLGIDSFLPPNASSLDGNAKNEINTSNAENDILLDINECSSSKDTSFGPSDSVNNDAATQDIKIDVTTTRNGNVSTGASALTTENDDIATPKSILDNPTTPEPDEGESKGEEEKMREKRFQREIVQLALCSSVSSLDSRQWTFLDEENQQPSVPKGVLRLFGDASLLHYVNSTIHLAYRRRGENNENKDLNYDDATPMISPNNPHQYYTPAVADVSVCYAKVRSSTIPQFFDKTAHPQHQHLYSNGQHPHFNQQNEQHRQSLPPPPPSSPSSQASSQIPKSIESAVHAAHAVAHGAKQLSSLAKRTGLAAAGKEMAAGLANAVNVGRSIHLGKNRSNPNSNTPNDDVTNNDVYNEVGEGSSTNPDQTMHQPPHLYDTGREGSFETALDGATNFQDAHGQVPLWKSGSGIENSVENYSSTPVHDRRGRRKHFFPDTPLPESNDGRSDWDAHINGGVITISLADLLPLPDGFDEWVVPDFCEMLHVPTAEYSRQQEILQQQYQQSQHPEAPQASLRRRPILFDRTTSIPSPADRNISDATSPSASSMGVEAMYLSPSTSLMSPDAGASPSNDKAKKGSIGTDSPLLSTASCNISSTSQFKDSTMDSRFLPTLASQKVLPHASHKNTSADSSHHDHVYIPILAFRRQRVGEKERFHEDPAVVDIQITCLDSNGKPPILVEEDDDDDEDGRGSSTMFQNGIHPNILKKSAWIPSCDAHNHTTSTLQQGLPVILLQRNISNGFADLPFPTRVLDRFPQKNYRGMPFPEEELPMFCYAGGSFLVRDKLRNLPMPRPFGFVVKNERGDSIYVSCLSFLEPLAKQSERQLDHLSKMRRDTSLPHRLYCQQNNKCYLVGFDDVVTFQNKTICLVGRYPYWTEFRRFLTHLHLLSGSSSDIPLERHVSHLLLSVPVPKPGGQAVLIPLSTMNDPMALVMPPLKDLPLLDLSYQRLFAALDVPTVVTIVLGFLCLETKVILISTRQSLVLDCCELLKSLLFPFELCAPYAPHLTEHFMSCLEFPGATFVGIYDDGQKNGLAQTVRDRIPEDSIIVDLDIGEIQCDGNRYETLKAAYQIIPADSRSLLIKEIEALCDDAGIVPGQEALDCCIDSAIDSTFPSMSEPLKKSNEHALEPLDDRAIRDNFLRFFCSHLGGYERFLLVPDADFLISGNDWFDSSKFLATSSPDRTPFLRALVDTQLFQSFIQRRTEASDVHCMLFDECLSEYHRSAAPYGRLGGGVESQVDPESDGHNHIIYHLLVDQCATEPDLLLEVDDCSFLSRPEATEKGYDHDNDASGYADSTISDNSLFEADTPFAINASGDIVTIPSTASLPLNARFLYCINGNPSFPTNFDRELFLPQEPEHLATEYSEVPPPILTRSEREREEAVRVCNMSVSRRGVQKQHRCLWQLAKFMGSQFLGAYLLCVPIQISQENLSIDKKSKILLRALGALRTLRSHRRVVADEAAYRALIVACGRCGTDRRTELMKLYGLMRTDSIFPNAVTLGQYTRAIAEGFSKRSMDPSGDSQSKVGMHVIVSSDGKEEVNQFNLGALDVNLSLLEESGLRWRSTEQAKEDTANGKQKEKRSLLQAKTFDTATTQRNYKTKRAWLPVTCSSSFCFAHSNYSGGKTSTKTDNVCLFALWSRVSGCDSCAYTPLDEEIQCGWDVVHDSLEMPSYITCPRCGSKILPQIGYKEMSIKEALGPEKTHIKYDDDVNISAETAANAMNIPVDRLPSLEVSMVEASDASLYDMPPQLETTIHDKNSPACLNEQGRSGSVTYVSPMKLRIMLEQLVLEFGEEVIDRDRLKALDPQIFFNLWWYSARFSLPLPLSTASSYNSNVKSDESDHTDSHDYCAFASWDKSVALQGCRSAAKAIMAAQALPSTSDRHVREKLFDNPNTDMPLLAFFNLQSYSQGDWDHADLSEILVALVKSCDSRDLFPVVECVFKRNSIRQEEKEERDDHAMALARRSMSRTGGNNALNTSFESAGTVSFSVGASTDASFCQSSTELDCYRTLLYLTRYQCTTAFHAFFPTTVKACKGYHFWCAQGTPLPIFDRAFREAAEEYNKKSKRIVPIPDVSDVALGFRCVFGHVI